LNLLEEHPFTSRTRIHDAYINVGTIYQTIGREDLARYYADLATTP